MNDCSWKPAMVALHDGRLVTSDSEEWRHEAEARHIISLPGTAARREFLRGTLDAQGKLRGGILEKRGIREVERLERTIKRIWYADRGQ